MLRAIDIKVFRDLKRMRGQAMAITLIIACGVGLFLSMNATMRSLQSARADYYAGKRFGHIFASLKRAPESVRQKLERIEGIQGVQTRVVADVTLDVPGLTEAATGRLISIPDRGRPLVNDLNLQSGQLPRRGAWGEVVASEAFMEAHDFRLGERVRAVVNGTFVELEVVGIALSPEYTTSIGPGLLFPDDRLFGVFWMRREGLATAFGMEGAFNDVSFRIARDTRSEEVVARVDEILARYGGLGAITRKDQTSAFYLENDLIQLEAFTYFVPALFLLVAAFLLNIVMGRLVGGQRGDIAALKAFGYGDSEIGFHYAKMLGVIVIAGWILGIVLASWMGSSMTELYGKYYRFPDLPFRMGLRAPLAALAVSVAAAGIGAWKAIRSTVLLPCAEAMRPQAPATYKPTALERLGLAPLLPASARLVLRELERRPMRGVLSVTGVAMAAALTILMAFGADSVRHMLNVQFGLSQRDDVQLTLVEPRSTAVLSELEQLPGVLHAEGYRAVPVEISKGTRRKRIGIQGVSTDATLLGILDEDLDPVAIPREGLVLSRKLAALLDVRAGEEVLLKILEGDRRSRRVEVSLVAETFVGLSVYMNLESLCRVLGETPTINGAHLLVDDLEMANLQHEVKRTPMIAGATSRDAVLKSVVKLLDENIGTTILISVVFSLVMAFGVLYNTARITLSERARELATLRVLGFRRSEVAAILIGELCIVIVVGIPIGCVAGYGLAAALVASPAFDTEQFRLPLVVTWATYAMAALAILASGLVSGWIAWRRLDAIDIVEVLKTRD